jgi:Fe-S-cluster containining protein
MIKSNIDFTYPSNVRFECSRCTLCCGDTGTKTRHILLLTKEAERISGASLRALETFACSVVGHEPYAYEMKKDKEGKCVFLRRNRCIIYAVRPLICRCYPFELKPERNGGHVFSPTPECPGLGSGGHLKEDYFSELFQLARERLN